MNWMDLLRDAVEENGNNRVAKELGVSRSTVHMVLKGTYRADTRNIEKRVLSVYGQALCPFLGRILSATDCRWYRERPVPMSHWDELRHWKACQECEAPIVAEASVPDDDTE